MAPKLTICVLAFLVAHARGDEMRCDEWNYDVASATGPLNWPAICSACGGSNQSPIAIDTSSAKQSRISSKVYKPLQITMVASGNSYVLKNTGHSLQMSFQQSHITVTGAGLVGKYIVSEMHWHWGSNDSVGSEHTVDSRRYPIEGHLVAYNSAYPDLNSARGRKNGVAVFSILYTVTTVGNGNVVYNTYFTAENLIAIKKAFSAIDVAAYDVNYLVPIYRLPFYRYTGSLTTPSLRCSEDVTWTVFAEPITILQSQVALLRSLHFAMTKGNDSLMVNNYRPLQNRNGRTVLYVHNCAASPFASSFAALIVASAALLTIV